MPIIYSSTVLPILKCFIPHFVSNSTVHRSRRVGGWELFGLGGFDHVRPLRQLEAALAFQVLREGRNELLRLHVLDVKEREAVIHQFYSNEIACLKHTHISIYLLPTCMCIYIYCFLYILCKNHWSQLVVFSIELMSLYNVINFISLCFHLLCFVWIFS